MNKLSQTYLTILVLILLQGCLQGHQANTLKTSLGHVIGGSEVLEKEEASSFNVFVGLEGREDAGCSGSLISPTFVLTAAHCLVKRDPMKSKIILGSVIKVSPIRGKIYTPKEVFIHPEYGGYGSVINDIGLVELSSPVEGYKSVALYDGPFVENSFIPTESYGYSVFTTSAVEHLLGFIKKSIYANQTSDFDFIDGVIRLRRKLFSSIFIKMKDGHERFMTLQPHGGVCSGDSGGPTVIDVKGEKIQIGINTSVDVNADNSTNCHGTALITPINSFVPWIKEKMAVSGSTLVTSRFDDQASLGALSTKDAVCAKVQYHVLNLLQEKVENILKDVCDEELIQELGKLLAIGEEYCLSDMSRDYPRFVVNTIKELKKNCKEDQEKPVDPRIE